MLATFGSAIIVYLREVAEIAVLGFFLAGLLHAYVRPEALSGYLGRGGAAGNGLAAIVGLILPLCCCSAVPAALSLYRGGAGRGPACAFLIATPWVNLYALGAVTVFLGARIAVLVAASAVLVAFATGMLLDSLTPRSALLPLDPPIASPSPGNGWIEFRDHRAKLRSAIGFMAEVGREVGPFMLAGVVLGALVQTLVPQAFFARHLGGARVAGLLAALAIATLLYADSLASLPWVQSLLSKGLGAGSTMVLLVAGVGTNISTLGPVARSMGGRTAAIYAASVVVLTGVLGLAWNTLH